MNAEEKEQVYDTQIAPLMTQIIDICKTHGLALIASYDFGGEDGRRCTTCLPDGDGVNGMGHTEALRYLHRGTAPRLLIHVVNADGTRIDEAIVG